MASHIKTKVSHTFPNRKGIFNYEDYILHMIIDRLIENDSDGSITIKGNYYAEIDGSLIELQIIEETFSAAQSDAMIAAMNLPAIPESERRAAIRLQGLWAYVSVNPIKTRDGQLAVSDFENV